MSFLDGSARDNGASYIPSRVSNDIIETRICSLQQYTELIGQIFEDRKRFHSHTAYTFGNPLVSCI